VLATLGPTFRQVVITENLVRTRSPSAGVADRGSSERWRSEARCPRSQSGECKEEFLARRNLVLARKQSALVRKTKARYLEAVVCRQYRHRRTITKQPGAGSDGEVLRPEESPRRARVLVSPLLSTLERPWLAPNVFSNAGSRQNTFPGSGATTFHSTR